MRAVYNIYTIHTCNIYYTYNPQCWSKGSLTFMRQQKRHNIKRRNSVDHYLCSGATYLQDDWKQVEMYHFFFNKDRGFTKNWKCFFVTQCFKNIPWKFSREKMANSGFTTVLNSWKVRIKPCLVKISGNILKTLLCKKPFSFFCET